MINRFLKNRHFSSIESLSEAKLLQRASKPVRRRVVRTRLVGCVVKTNRWPLAWGQTVLEPENTFKPRNISSSKSWQSILVTSVMSKRICPLRIPLGSSWVTCPFNEGCGEIHWRSSSGRTTKSSLSLRNEMDDVC